jgi:uncharacterized membrane protein
MERPTDHDLDIAVAGMLRFGVSLAALVVLVGGMMILRHPWTAVPSYDVFHAGGPGLRTLRGIWSGLIKGQPRSIVQFGMVLLIATPVARVVICVVGFARQRDKLYVIVSLVVLAVLIYSLTKGGS